MKIENWKEELVEYGQLHNEDCCVNFPEDNRACDCSMKDDDCCENIRMSSNFVKEICGELINHLSFDMKFDSEEQRKEAVKMYCEHFDFEIPSYKYLNK